MPRLQEILRHEIAQIGPVSFARFMDLALYHPESGYYEKHPDPIAVSGDFYTSTRTGPLFGELLAFQFAQWLELITDSPLDLVEIGAHQGDLSRDIARTLEQHHPALWEKARLHLIEPSPTRKDWQRRTLGMFTDKVTWVDSVEQLPESGVQGVIFSNEFLDALPVHRIGWDAQEHCWFEWGVTWRKDRFDWDRLERLDAALEEALALALETCPEGLFGALPQDYTVELSPAAFRWWADAATRLRTGWLMTIDYGLTDTEWLMPERHRGTLRAYHRHQVHENVLHDPGGRDITAHVHFDALRRIGSASGLSEAVFTTQEQFLTRIFGDLWTRHPKWLEGIPRWKSQFQTLTHPDFMGRPFRALVMQKRKRGQPLN